VERILLKITISLSLTISYGCPETSFCDLPALLCVRRFLGWFDFPRVVPQILEGGETNGNPNQIIIDGLAVDRKHRELGEMWESNEISASLPITNITNQTIEVKNFAVSCGCLSVYPHAMILPPGETRTVEIKVNTSERDSSELVKLRRSYELLIYPITSLPRKDQEGWRFHAIVNSRATTNIRQLTFGDGPVHNQSPFWRKLRVTLHIPDVQLHVSGHEEKATIKTTVGENASVINLEVAPPFQV
jgi:hypothetical protein